MSKKDIKVPNIGEFKDVEVIEVLIKKGQKIKKNDPLITIESDKSSVEIPSSDDGTVTSLNVKIGDKVSEGDKIIEIESEKEIKETSAQELPKSQLPKEIKKNDVKKTNESENIIVKDFSTKASASPKVRKFARELGVNINKVPGSERQGRVTESDVKLFVATKSDISDLVATNNFTSLSVTLPCLSLPGTLLILTPSSLANFLTFGEAEAFVEKSLTIIFSDSLVFFTSFFFISFGNWLFGNSWALVSFISFSLSISIILSPSDTLSPILTFKEVTVPSSDDGISTLDLSLSIVISGSFFLIFWPFLIKTSMTSTSLNSPIFGTFISFFDIIILSALVYLYQFDTSLLPLEHI